MSVDVDFHTLLTGRLAWPSSNSVRHPPSGIVAAQKLELEKYEVCKKEKEELEAKVGQLRVKIYDIERQNEKMQVDRRHKKSMGGANRKSGKASLANVTAADASATKPARASKAPPAKTGGTALGKSAASLKRASEEGNTGAKAEKSLKARDEEWKKSMGPALALLVSGACLLAPRLRKSKT